MSDCVAAPALRVRDTALVLVLWVASVLPMATLGYGGHEDPWLIADAAWRMPDEHRYIPSRATGYPLTELIAIPLVRVGEWYASNLIGILSGVALLLALHRLAGAGALRHPALTMVTLLFLPLILKNGSATNDHLPSLAAIVWAYAFLLERRGLAAAVLVGIAAGFRPTGGLVIIPAMLYAWLDGWGRRRTLRMGAVAFAVGLACFSPSVLSNGAIGCTYDVARDLTLFVSWSYKILYTGYYFLQAFGIVQTALLGVVLTWALRRAPATGRESPGQPFIVFHLANIAVWCLLFAVHGTKPEFLMPLMPSVVLLIDRLTPRRVFVVTSAALLSYNVVGLEVVAGESGMRHIEPSIRWGYTVRDAQARRFKLSTRRVGDTFEPDRPTMLLYGDMWIPAANDRWERLRIRGREVFHRKGSDFWIAKQYRDEDLLRTFVEDYRFRLVVWRGYKREYLLSESQYWRDYVEVVPDLGEFFGTPVRGAPTQ